MRHFTVVDCEQRTPEWTTARLGRVTGSRVADMLATLKSGKGEAAGRRNYRVQLVLERLTGHPHERGFVSQAMQTGIEREADAFVTYEALTGTLLQRCGFLSHTELMSGCSLDGVIGDFEGIVEMKCPLPATHLEFLKTGVIDGDYLKQIQHGLWISGAAWCDFVSFHPDFPDPIRVRIVRVARDEAACQAHELLVRQFLREVDEEVAAVAALIAKAA